MSVGLVEASITAQNTGTDAIKVGARELNAVADYVTGTFVATVHLQRRFIDNGTTGNWIDVESTVSNFNKNIIEIEDEVEFRLFCKTGNFTSGTGYLRLSY